MISSILRIMIAMITDIKTIILITSLLASVLFHNHLPTRSKSVTRTFEHSVVVDSSQLFAMSPNTNITLPKKLPLLIVYNGVLLPGSTIRIPVTTVKR